MSGRIGFWLAGLCFGSTLAAVVPESWFPGARVLTFGATFLSLAWLGEGWSALMSSPRAPQRSVRLADGRVDIARVAGTQRHPNPLDPRFGHFVGLDPDLHPNPDSDPSGTPPALSPARIDRGRSLTPPLLGRIVVVSLFLGRDGTPWSDQELAEAHHALQRAGVWLETEAVRWGAPVNLELADTYFLHDLDADAEAKDEVLLGYAQVNEAVISFEQRGAFKALVAMTRAADALGFRDAEAMFRKVHAAAGGDMTVWLLHPRRAGRSFALPSGMTGLVGQALAVCFASERPFPERLSGPARTDPVTVVHELLHLFGATDKYGLPLRRFAPRSVTSRDVMRLGESRLSRLRIDPQTAAEIGWLVNKGNQRTTAGA